MYVKPGPHPDHPDDETKTRVVRIPHTREILPDEGREVPENQFWHRRVAHGDVVLVKLPAPATVVAIQASDESGTAGAGLAAAPPASDEPVAEHA